MDEDASSAEGLRKRAAELREQAARTKEGAIRTTLLGFAANFERLAAQKDAASRNEPR
jgi:hypothetical protein